MVVKGVFIKPHKVITKNGAVNTCVPQIIGDYVIVNDVVITHTNNINHSLLYYIIMSFFNAENDSDKYGKEIDPLIQSQQKNKYYSLTSRPADVENGLSDYCQFCLLHFHKFHIMRANVCQVCGRVAEPIRRDKQDSLAVTSINSSASPPNIRAVSMEIDYSPITSDPTHSIIKENERMTANSIGEAVRKLRYAEQSNTRMTRAALTGQKYIVKTTGHNDKNKAQLDNNL